MKNLIYQYFEPTRRPMLPKEYEFDRDYWQFSQQSISKYAEKIGAEYLFEESGAPFDPHYSIFNLFIDDRCHEWDNICFIDCDVLATTLAKNIFENSSKTHVSVIQSNTGPLHTEPFEKIAEWRNCSELNTGVVVFPRSTYSGVQLSSWFIETYHKIDSWEHGGFDQELMWDYAKQYGFCNLEPQFNYMVTYYKPEHRWNQSLIHYHYNMKHKLPHDFQNPMILK